MIIFDLSDFCNCTEVVVEIGNSCFLEAKTHEIERKIIDYIDNLFGDWLHKNISHYRITVKTIHHPHSVIIKPVISFQNNEDALAFKIVWSCYES